MLQEQRDILVEDISLLRKEEIYWTGRPVNCMGVYRVNCLGGCMKVKARSSRMLLLFLGAVSYPGWVVSDDVVKQPAKTVIAPVTHMSEELRASVSKIVILASPGAGSESVTGSYNKETPGLLGGMADGSQIGTIPVEVGQVPVGIPIPILREIGMIFGAISGGAKAEIQDFRDKLTDDLRDAVDQPLTNDSLANDVFWGLKNVSTLEPKIYALTTPVPEDTEAILYVSLTGLVINVQEDEAIIEIAATARLERRSDNSTLYRKEVTYQDQDTLGNWTANDTQLWREYRNFARHYLGREISAELFERVALNHELVPKKTDTIKPVKKNNWQATTKVRSPTLAWDFKILDVENGGEWQKHVDPATMTWDLEIYDRQRPVYSAQNISGSLHAIGTQLNACETYYWTVRPRFLVDGVKRNGDWMRRVAVGVSGNGNIGRKVSEAHAYIQDFAAFKVDCRAR